MDIELRGEAWVLSLLSDLNWKAFRVSQSERDHLKMLHWEIRAIAADAKLRPMLRQRGYADDDIVALLQHYRYGPYEGDE